MSARQSAENKSVRRVFLAAAYILGSLSGAFAEEPFAQKMEDLLAKEYISAEEAAWWTLAGARHIDADTLETAAFFIAQNKKWLPVRLRHDDALRRKDAAQLIAGAFHLRGSLWYALTKTGRAAFHLFQAKNMLDARRGPLDPISGADFLYCLQRARGG